MRISLITASNIVNRNNLSKSNVRFGESECCDSFYRPSSSRTNTSNQAKWLAKKDEIEAHYSKQLDNLAKFADDVGMDNDYYWKQVNKIRAERDHKLAQAKVLYSRVK